MNKLRIGWLLLCCTAFLQAGFSQQAYVDSLRQVFYAEKNPFKKIDVFYEIANDRSFGNAELSFAYADSLEKMSRKAGYKKGLAMSKHLRGFGHDYLGEYEKALALFQEELAIFIELNDKEEVSTVYNNMGSIWGNMGQTDSCIAYYLKALAIDEERGDSLGASIIYNNIGNIYSDEGVYDRAIEYFEIALKIRQHMGVEKRYLQCYTNLSSVYGRKQDFQKAEEYAMKGLELAVKYDNKNSAGIIANNLGSSYNEMKQYRNAVSWLEKGLASWKAIGNEAYMTYAYYNLAEAYAGLGDGAKALQYANEGFEIVQKLKLTGQHELYYKVFALAHEAKGNAREALTWYKKYMTLADSLFKVDNTKKVAQIETQYQTQKKEAQLARQQLEIERSTTRQRNILVGAIAVLLALGAGFYYFRNKQRIRQKEAELAAQLQHAETEKLREMDALKSTFFANISHEFRTPLTLIISPLRQLLDNPGERPKASLFRTMLLSGERLLELVNQLLDLAKAEAGQLELQPVEADVLPVLRGIAGSFTSLADVRQIHFETAMPSGEVPARFDKDKLSKIVANLLSNAFKFTPEEGRVSLEAHPVQDNGTAHLHIIVRDNGMGISESELPYLFERFYQAKETNRASIAGSGIGLALTKELVELHGGTIYVESPDPKSDGNGTVFTVTLPILLSAPSELREDMKIEVLSGTLETIIYPAVAQDSPMQIKSGQPQVLVVEDNPDVRLFIKDCLEKDYNVILAADGPQGLEIACKIIPDLVISDVMMPQMDGFELCHALKNDTRTSHIPVVLLTARAEKADKMEGLLTGADDYLVKPFDARELQVRVANLIAQRQKLQEHYRSSLSPFTGAPIEAESMDALFLQNVKVAVEANLDDENFSVVELGSKIGMSRSQLHRKLSALTGFSPNEVIRNMRLERAKVLLEKQTATVSEVAYLCGFNSPAYFIKCFKDHFGITPGEV